MANPEHLAILKQGAERWNNWRKQHPEVLHVDLAEADLRGKDLHVVNLDSADLAVAALKEADLSYADFRAADLRRADLRRSNLDGAVLAEANLYGADLSGASLVHANLSGAGLHGASLRGASLIGANLQWANLEATNFSGADLEKVDLTHASAFNTNFADINLRNVRGLEAVQHRGPSTVGIDTIYNSRGEIPEVFLRGCGVPDNLITYMHSLTGQAFEFYSCFISYSTYDQGFAERLHADLQAKGVRCWFAPHDIHGGRKLHEQIDEAIRLHDKLLLILSQPSMHSEWVKTEIAKARKREVKEGNRVLFPVRLVPFEVLRDWECFDADTGKDSAREIREYFIPDFSNWKDHDSYKTAFERLVSDLKAETKE